MGVKTGATPRQAYQPIPYDPGYEVKEIPFSEWLKALRREEYVRVAWADTVKDEMR